MSVETLRRPGRAESDHDSADVHLVCDCNPDLALCGSDRSGRPFAPDDAQLTCVVCADLYAALAGCPRCGE